MATPCTRVVRPTPGTMNVHITSHVPMGLLYKTTIRPNRHACGTIRMPALWVRIAHLNQKRRLRVQTVVQQMVAQRLSHNVIRCLRTMLGSAMVKPTQNVITKQQPASMTIAMSYSR